jgi:hypothetical protein
VHISVYVLKLKIIRSPLIVLPLQLESWLGSLNRGAGQRQQHRWLLATGARPSRESYPADHPWAGQLCDPMIRTTDGTRNFRVMDNLSMTAIIRIVCLKSKLFQTVDASQINLVHLNLAALTVLIVFSVWIIIHYT